MRNRLNYSVRPVGATDSYSLGFSQYWARKEEKLRDLVLSFLLTSTGWTLALLLVTCHHCPSLFLHKTAKLQQIMLHKTPGQASLLSQRPGEK